jgi:hypothetical protein
MVPVWRQAGQELRRTLSTSDDTMEEQEVMAALTNRRKNPSNHDAESD